MDQSGSLLSCRSRVQNSLFRKLPERRLRNSRRGRHKKLIYNTKQNKKEIIMKTLGILVFGVVALMLASILSQAIEEFFSQEDYVLATVLRVADSTIIIGNNCTAIIAETSPERAESIAAALEKRVGERPNTHDTIAQILKSFNITLESVRMERYDSRFYYSDIYLRSKEKLLKLDVMPSDGIALALRMNASIYVNKTLLNEIGKNIC